MAQEREAMKYRWSARTARRLLSGTLSGALFSASLFFVTGWASLYASTHESPLAPKFSIPTEPLGYRAPGPIYTLVRLPFATLNFLDADHLLFTFHQPRLMKRDEHESGSDQYVQAVVLELPSGKETARTEWRLHDRNTYLWQLGDGRILLRQAEDLFTTDASLKLTLLLHAPSHLQQVQVSPDGKMLMVEMDAERHTPEEHARLRQRALDRGTNPPDEDVQIRMIDLGQRQLKLAAKSERPGPLPTNVEGFVTQVQTRPNHWELRFHPFEKPEKNGGDIVAQLMSSCPPQTDFVNASTVLVLSACSTHAPDRQADAVGVDGKKLWTGRWRADFAWPTIAASTGGSDFAIAWIAVDRPVAQYDSFGDTEVRGQFVDVLDAKTGGLRLALLVQPIASAGENYALSPDGNRLAVLNKGMIEVYDVPAAPPPPPAVAAKK
ncbi:MAG: hypothetical protein ACR2JE_07890 [Acidobacteriaceae bacterium]